MMRKKLPRDKPGPQSAQQEQDEILETAFFSKELERLNQQGNGMNPPLAEDLQSDFEGTDHKNKKP
jgi:hypothetical protein